MKKLNLTVAILVAAALTLLVVLLISTFIGGSDKTDEPSPSPSPSEELPVVTPPDGGIVETPDIGETDEDEPEASPDVGLTAELTGERYTLVAFFGREKLSITVDEDNFTRETMEDGELYYLSEDSSRGTFLEIVFVEDELASRKAGFIDAYIPDYTSMDTLGLIVIGSSDVIGEGITASNGKSTVETWLIEADKGFFAVSAGYESTDGRQLIYRMLNTISFEL